MYDYYNDHGTWTVYYTDFESVVIIAGFETEEEADETVARWNKE